MSKKFFWISIAAVFISFFGGFLLANALNRSEMNEIRAENAGLKNAQSASPQNDSESSLSGEEIRQKIAQADQNPANISYQKNLGIALYRYAAMKQDSDLLNEVARLLNRVYEKDSKDFEVLVTLGNVYFDIGYLKKENENFLKARELYQKALEQKATDDGLRTDYGLTFFLEKPPQTDKAIAEFQKALQTNPENERALESLTQAFLSQNKIEEAEKTLAKLKEINPDNQSLPDLSNKVSAGKNGAENQ